MNGTFLLRLVGFSSGLIFCSATNPSDILACHALQRGCPLGSWWTFVGGRWRMNWWYKTRDNFLLFILFHGNGWTTSYFPLSSTSGCNWRFVTALILIHLLPLLCALCSNMLLSALTLPCSGADDLTNGVTKAWQFPRRENFDSP